jgi:hypothetical protein
LSSSKIDGVALEVAELDELERRLMGRGENDAWGAAGLEGFAPARGAEAPAVARFKSRKAELWPRRGEVVAARLGEARNSAVTSTQTVCRPTSSGPV